MEQNTFYVDGKPVGAVNAEELRAQLREWTTPDEPTERRIDGKEATSVIVDELSRLRNSLTAYLRGLELTDSLPGWLWTSHRTRNLSHRPVVGARKRKAALKHAARQHRVVVRFS